MHHPPHFLCVVNKIKVSCNLWYLDESACAWFWLIWIILFYCVIDHIIFYFTKKMMKWHNMEINDLWEFLDLAWKRKNHFNILKSMLVSFCSKRSKPWNVVTLQVIEWQDFYICFQPLTVLVRGVARVTRRWRLRGWGVSMTTAPPHLSGSSPTTHRPSPK